MNDIVYLPRTLIEVLSNTYHNGYVKWDQCIIGKDISLLKEMNKVDLTNYMFGGLSLYNYKDSFLNQEYLENLDPKVEFSQDNKMCYFSANASVLCGMVNLNPGKETSDLYNFMLKVQSVYSEFYEKFPKQRSDLHLVLNKKEATGKLLDEMKLVLSSEKNISVEEDTYLNQQLALLKKMIFSEKNILSWYLFNQRILNRSRNKTKMIFTSESFFKKENNPYLQQYSFEFEERESKEEKSEYFIKEANEKMMPTYASQSFFIK